MSGDEVETSTGTQVETTRKLAAQRQIDAAIDHIKRLELEFAITLAAAAETTLPDTANPHFLELLRQHPSFLRKEVNFNETTNWLMHYIPPDIRYIFEQEAALVIIRAISKFCAVYDDSNPAWLDFLEWGNSKRFWPVDLSAMRE